jgi:MFS family permease
MASRDPRGLALTGAALVGALTAIYAVSQFLRNSIGVIANDLAREFSLSATEIGLLSSGFFLAFAAAQIPVGISIDRYGPTRTMLGSAVLCVAGILLFAAATTAPGLIAARMLMGLGCSTFFMGPLAIFAKRFPGSEFAFLTSALIALGSLGTLLATAPLAEAAGTFGWRGTFVAVAGVTAVFAFLVAVLVGDGRDGEERYRESWRDAFRGVRAAMRAPSFWPVFVAHATAYASFATVIGLWAGPWLSDVFGADLAARGNILSFGALAQIAGLLLWGVCDRYWRSYRRPVLFGGWLSAALLMIPALLPLSSGAAALWLAVFGFVLAYTPIVTAHGKSLFPPELLGRGITLLNMGTMGGVFLIQTATGVLVDLIGRTATGAYAPAAYQAVFLVLALALAISLVFYARAGDSHPCRDMPKA